MTTRRIALLFAGQGAQKVGMGRDLADKYPAAARLFERADKTLGRNLSAIAFEGPDEDLTRTANCQPALYVHGLACLEVLRELAGEIPFVATAGLSLGEFTAHAAAGTFSFESGLELVGKRGAFMDEACEATNGSMAAMIGADETLVRELAAEADVDVANLNCPGQVVVSGEAAKIALALGIAREKGVRMAKELKVAGAYHSRLMESAYQKLGAELEHSELAQPRVPVICNVDAIPVLEPAAIRRSLQEQVTGTVRWTECVEYLLDEMECDLFIELGPGGVLAGLMNRIRKGVEVLSVSDCAGVEAAAEKLKSA